MNKEKEGRTNGDSIGVNKVETSVFTFFAASEESKYCFCSICCENYELKEKGKQFLRQSSSMFNIDCARMKKFYQFISNVDQKVYFRLQIPQICFFEGGEGKWLFRTKGNMVVGSQMTAEMKKTVANLYIDNRRHRNNTTNVSEGGPNHLKYFEAIIPSYKHGLSNNDLNNRPRNYTFHCQKRQQEGEVIRVHQSGSSEVAVIKYKDKGLQLVNEKQLRLLLKSPLKTQHIQLIQSYVKPHQKHAQFIFSEYSCYRKPSNMLMFNRSLAQLKIQINLLSKYSKDYIPIEHLEQYENLLKEIAEEYCLYQTYKMIHYMEINRDIKVKELITVWFRDQDSEISYFGIMQFQYDQNEQVTPDVTQIDELNDLMNNQLTELEKELLNAWNHMKKRKNDEFKKKFMEQK